jgi:predicted GTPase
MNKRKTIIMGAAGRDFHNFLVCFRDNPGYEVVAFTAAQIPGIAKRRFPKELAGRLYRKDVPIYPEKRLPKLIKELRADEVVLAYSDLSNREVMERANLVLSSGADFRLMGPDSTMLKSRKPVISVCAVRTGAGKSPTTRKLCSILKEQGKKFVIVRHPMPYGSLMRQSAQRFAELSDLERNECTIEEMEEYEPHLREGYVVYAGVDYAKILRSAEKEADIILWDGGNNDLPFYRPDLHIVIADPHRPGHELRYYPGTTNLMMADLVIINKIDTASPRNVKIVERNVRKINPKAAIIKAESPVNIDRPELVEGKSVIAVDDGPTITHGGMPEGAGSFAAKKYRVKEIIDPRPYATGSIRDAYQRYPHMGNTLPALGYSSKQVKELEQTINRAKCDSVVAGTPIVLQKHLKINKPIARVSYTLKEVSGPTLKAIVKGFLKRRRS